MTPELQVFDGAVRLKEAGREVEFTEQILLLGLLHYYKSDRALSQRRVRGVTPTYGELQAFIDAYTDQQLHDFRDMAIQSLDRCVEQRLVKASFWPSVRASTVGCLCYSLLLLAALAIVHFFGVDVLSGLKAITG